MAVRLPRGTRPHRPQRRCHSRTSRWACGAGSNRHADAAMGTNDRHLCDSQWRSRQQCPESTESQRQSVSSRTQPARHAAPSVIKGDHRSAPVTSCGADDECAADAADKRVATLKAWRVRLSTSHGYVSRAPDTARRRAETRAAFIESSQIREAVDILLSQRCDRRSIPSSCVSLVPTSSVAHSLSGIRSMRQPFIADDRCRCSRRVCRFVTSRIRAERDRPANQQI